MSNPKIITKEGLSGFRKTFRRTDESYLFLGVSHILFISGGAQKLLGLAQKGKNHVLIAEDEKQISIKKSPKIEGQTWEIVQYKDGGLRLSSAILCRFLRKKYNMSGNDKARFFLEKGKGKEVNLKPPVIIRKEPSDV